MVKKDSYTWKIYGWLVAALCIVPAFLHAQEKDFTTWASAGFKYDSQNSLRQHDFEPLYPL